MIHNGGQDSTKATLDSRKPLKVGLFLEDTSTDKFLEKRNFDKFMTQLSMEALDLFVFPEYCKTPLTKMMSNLDIQSPSEYEEFLSLCRPLSIQIGCPIIYSGDDYRNTIFSVYVNPFAKGNETKDCIYIKHTATGTSAFDRGYANKLSTAFPVIGLNGYRLGMTICYDCTHALFSRAYGKQKVDILINSTGGNVQRTKWHRYIKARALENQCFSLCTMGSSDNTKSKSFAFAFSPGGSPINWTKCIGQTNESDMPDHVYVYDLDPNCIDSEVDISIAQDVSVSKNVDWKLDPHQLDTILSLSSKIDEGIHVLPVKDQNVVFIIMQDDDVTRPELLCKKLYSQKLKSYKNKRYMLINRWTGTQLDGRYFKERLSDILKTRAAENFIAVLLVSPLITKCYQPGSTKNVQDVCISSDGFGIDFKRMGGPEVIWKRNPRWRAGYELLIDYLQE